MFKAKIVMNHYHCWACEITKKLNLDLFLQNTVCLKPNVASDILYAKVNSTLQNSILQFLKHNNFISSYDILEQTQTELFILIITSGNQTMIERINKNSCHIIGPTKLSKGEETFSVITKDKININHLLEDLNTIGEARLRSVNQWSFESADLTKKQHSALALANNYDYYNWPRKIDITHLAKMEGISKSAFIERLRKAEMKVIKHFADEHF